MTTCLPAARAWGVQDDQVRLGDLGAGQDRVDLAVFDADPGQVLEVVLGVLRRAAAGFDAEHRARLAHALGDGSREQAHPAVEVERRLALAGHQALHHGLHQDLGGLRVDLPEAAHADAPGAVVRAFADEGAAVDAVDSPVVLLDPQHGHRLVQFDQREAGRP